MKVLTGATQDVSMKIIAKKSKCENFGVWGFIV
jgi:hypothetical protein